MERRLAAILAADVVGYSRLMEADEALLCIRSRPASTNWLNRQSMGTTSAFLISKILATMNRNGFGVIANTVAAEGLSYGAYFSSAMVGQRSMVLSPAGEIDKDAGVSVFGFAPGVVDTQLVTEDTATLHYYGMTLEEWIENFVSNLGYEARFWIWR